MVFILGKKLLYIQVFIIFFCLGTYAQCGDPFGLQVNIVSDSSADFTWSHPSTNATFTFAYKPLNSSNWTEVIQVSSTSWTLSNLLNGTAYKWAVRANCGQTGLSSLIIGPEFTTTGPKACQEPLNLQANAVSETSTRFEWDASNGVSTYRLAYRKRDHGTIPWDSIIYTTNTIYTASGLQSGTTYIWGVITECDALLTESGFIYGPEFQTLGTVRCEDPKNLRITYNSSTSVTLSCDPSTGATQYRFAYRQLGQSGWENIIDVSQNTTLISVVQGIDYEWGVRALCPTENTVSALIYGSSFVGSARCRAPINLRSYERKVGMILRWNNRPEAQSYELQIRIKGTPGWWTYNTSNFILVVTGATPGVAYEWRVRSICDVTGGFVSDYSSILTFTPSSNPSIMQEVVSNKSSGSKLSKNLTMDKLTTIAVLDIRYFPDLGFYVFGPNPARNMVYIDALISEKIHHIGMYNIKGEKINITLSTFDVSNILDTGQLSTGVYLLIITTEDGVFREKLVIL